MNRLHGFLGAEVPSRRHKIVVIQMPDQRRPRIVQHPLNHARRRVLVSSIRFEHRALAVIGHGLRFALIVLQRGRHAIPSIQPIGKHIDCREPFAARVEIPHIVDWPQMILGDKALKRFARRNRRSRAGLRVVTVRPTGRSVG